MYRKCKGLCVWYTICYAFLCFGINQFHLSVTGLKEFKWSKYLSEAYFLDKTTVDLEKTRLLRDLIAASGLVILLKLDWNPRLFSLCDLEIWWRTSKNNRALLLYYVKLCASFQIHQWIQTWVTGQKCSIQVEIGDILSCVTLKFDEWPWKTIGHLFYTTLSVVQHFKTIRIFKLELQSQNPRLRSKLLIFFPVWPWKLTDDPEKQYVTSPVLLKALCIIS